MFGSILAVLGLKPVSGSPSGNLTGPFDSLFTQVTVISIVVLLLVLVLWTLFIVRYREGNEETERKELSETFSNRLELGWTAVAFLIIIFLMIASYPVLINTIDNNEQNVQTITGKTPTKIIVEGTASWQWRFHLENGTVIEPVRNAQGVSYTNITLHTNTPYEFILWSSGNIIHSFFVRDLNFKMDVTPGNNNTFSVVINNPGQYPIRCAEFCGPGHSHMRGNIFAVGESA